MLLQYVITIRHYNKTICYYIMLLHYVITLCYYIMLRQTNKTLHYVMLLRGAAGALYYYVTFIFQTTFQTTTFQNKISRLDITLLKYVRTIYN